MLGMVESLARRLAYALAGIGGVLIVLMMIQVIADVLARLLFSFPLPGTIEIVSHYYMIGATFLPLAVIQLNEGHFAADSLRAFVSARAINGIDGIIGIAFALASGLAAWQTLQTAWESASVGEHVQNAFFVLPIWPARWCLPAGFALLAVIALVRAIRALRGTAAEPSRPPSDTSITS